MKTNYHNLLGKEITLTATDAVWHLNHALCESILCTENSKPSGLTAGATNKNIFGRPLTFSSSNDISFSIGFAATGLRSGIMIPPDAISSNIENIAHAVRVHIPLVIFADAETQFQINQLAQSGAVVFSACSTQEALDLLLVSYRIAELSLIPVVICIDESLRNKEETVLFPDKETMVIFAGNTDKLISSPSPSQQLIFGQTRKRIPNWFNIDNPVSIGAAKRLNEAALETAAQEEYFYSHLDRIIEDSFQELNKLTGRKCNDIEQHNSKDAEYLLLSYGSISQTILKAIDEFRSTNKVKIAAARLVQLNPFPTKAVKAILAGKKVVTVLEQATVGIGHSTVFKEISSYSESKQLKVYSGNYGIQPSSAALHDVIMNMLPGGKGKLKFWMELNFTRPNSNFPKHQVLMQAVEREYPKAQDKTLSPTSFSKSNQTGNSGIPLSIRKYKDRGPAYTKLSRFYDDTASFFLTNPEELIADPFQAIPVMPPSTANLPAGQTDFESAKSGAGRIQLPNFYSDACTGCGDCFVHCPHSAINPLVIGIENLIKAGSAISTANGVKITQLTPLIKNISKNIHEVIKQNKGNINSAADFIPAAFENVALQMNLEGDKLQAAKKDIEAVTSALKDLPFSITDVFYNNPDSINKGSGELFTLAVDANSCTGCSVCASVCKEDALQMAEYTLLEETAYHAPYALWEQLPDTNAETITRLLDEKNFNPFAAILLSRHFNLALNGISNDKGGDSSKAMVHLLIAIAEASVQPKVKEAIKTIDDLVSGLSQNIHAQLGSALPSQDFDALSKVLSEIKEDKKPFEELIEKLGTGDRLKLVDTKSLKRKVDLTNSLKTLKWLLSDGSTGTGRARMGIALDSSLNWTNSYPWNNFTSPVFIQLNCTSPELAKGLVQGHIRQLIDNIKIIRRAELEIKGTYEPEVNDVQIASITWNDLTDKEKNLIPPIILIGSRAKLAGKELNSLINMLDSNWPLKAIVLDDAAPETDHAVAGITGGIGTLLPALALQNAHVIKSSLAVPQHLFSGLREAFNSSKPALAWIFVPAVSKHLIPSEAFPKLPALSLNSRAFPHFNFNPRRSEVQNTGSLLSSCIDIDGNPQNESIWVHSDLSFKENGEDKTLSYALTWADWAYTLKSWSDHFILHHDAMGKSILVSEFILLPKSERIGKSPVIFRIDHHAELKKYKVSEEVIEATEACAHAWQVLREISGELSEFPEKLSKKTESILSEKYEKRMLEATKEFENKISNLEQDHLEKIRVKLKDKLLMLSHKSNGK